MKEDEGLLKFPFVLHVTLWFDYVGLGLETILAVSV